jgi:hypothetical protein
MAFGAPRGRGGDRGGRGGRGGGDRGRGGGRGGSRGVYSTFTLLRFSKSHFPLHWITILGE